jgi:hypothetical protein
LTFIPKSKKFFTMRWSFQMYNCTCIQQWCYSAEGCLELTNVNLQYIVYIPSCRQSPGRTSLSKDFLGAGPESQDPGHPEGESQDPGHPAGGSQCRNPDWTPALGENSGWLFPWGGSRDQVPSDCGKGNQALQTVLPFRSWGGNEPSCWPLGTDTLKKKQTSCLKCSSIFYLYKLARWSLMTQQ